jgi:hypothetical protein
LVRTRLRPTPSKPLLLVILFTTLLLAQTPPSLADTTTSRQLGASGTVLYHPNQYETLVVNPTHEVGTNTLSLGFQLDRRVTTWIRSETLQDQAKDGGFKLVRFFHHRLGAATGSGSVPCSRWDEATQTGVWDGWRDIDTLIESIFAIGAEPLLCFGYYSLSGDRLSVPAGMSTDNDGLPRPETWANYCVEWLRHFDEEGYPVRFFEIVNEPYHYFGWTDMTRLRNYVEFWNTVARALRSENPDILLSQDASTLRAVLDYWIEAGDDIDFIDFHKYDSPINGRDAGDEEVLDRAESYYFTTTQSIYSVAEAREIWRRERGLNLPVVLGETNLSYKFSDGTDPRIQEMIGAVHTALVIRQCVLEEVDYHLYWEFHDRASDPENHPGYGFGMVNTDNYQPWYPYYVQHWIGNNLQVGDQLVDVDVTSNDIRALAWIHDDTVNLLLVSKTEATQILDIQGLPRDFTITWIDDSIPFTEAAVQTDIIDDGEQITLNGYTVALIQASA